MTPITMPKLSDSMDEGTILTWLIEDGRPVAVGDELVEIETDKATMTYEAEAAGVLTITEPAGASVRVGAVIAQLDADASASVLAAAAVPVAGGAAPAAGKGAPAMPAPVPGAAATPVASEAAPAAGEDAPAATTAAASAPSTRAAATPLARRVSHVHSIELAGVAGTGPRGRITRDDVLRAGGLPVPDRSKGHVAVARAAPAAASPVDTSLEPGVSFKEPGRVQRLIARRMSESRATIPEFEVQTEVAMDEAIAMRARLKAVAVPDGVTPSLNDLVVKASAVALGRHPRANGSWRDERFALHEHVHVGIAVAADDALVVPVIRNADIMSLGWIAREARKLSGGVRRGASRPEDLAGGTFTVSNLGMFGMTAIWPVINAPQAAILGVGSLREVLARADGEIVDRTLMTLTLSCDHRILYGADAARFLAEIKALLEAPLGLLL